MAQGTDAHAAMIDLSTIMVAIQSVNLAISANIAQLTAIADLLSGVTPPRPEPP